MRCAASCADCRHSGEFSERINRGVLNTKTSKTVFPEKVLQTNIVPRFSSFDHEQGKPRLCIPQRLLPAIHYRKPACPFFSQVENRSRPRTVPAGSCWRGWLQDCLWLP